VPRACGGDVLCISQALTLCPCSSPAGGSKPATLETGAVVNVPLFINVGEDIMVDTRNDVYLSRQGGSSF
jgi:hypothetical protein